MKREDWKVRRAKEGISQKGHRGESHGSNYCTYFTVQHTYVPVFSRDQIIDTNRTYVRTRTPTHPHSPSHGRIG